MFVFLFVLCDDGLEDKSCFSSGKYCQIVKKRVKAVIVRCHHKDLNLSNVPTYTAAVIQDFFGLFSLQYIGDVEGLYYWSKTLWRRM